MTQKSKKVETVRVTATVSKSVLDTWRQVAAIEGKSLSGLVADWMAELEPGLRDIVKLRTAWEAADATQREAMRSAVTATGDHVEDTVLTGWDSLISTFTTEANHAE